MGQSLKTAESVQTATTDEESNPEKAQKCKKGSNGLTKSCGNRGSMKCPCGSKRKYSECCRKSKKSSSKSFELSKESQLNSTRTSKNNNASKTTVAIESKEEAPEIAGVFRKLKI